MRSLLALRRFFATKKYTRNHEWIEFNPDKKSARIGISDYAQQRFGEIISVEFPSVGKTFNQAQSTVVIQGGVNKSNEVYTPVSGKVLRVNKEVEKNPSMVNQNAESAWLVEVSYESEPGNLLSAEDYKKTFHG